jgi:outer membrane usher protein FimD/PapC
MSRGSLATAATTLAVLAQAAPGTAQDPRYALNLNLTGAGVYDDNIYFARAHPVGGAMMRFRPAANGRYRVSPDFSLEASYSFDADYFPTEPELTDLFASHGGMLGGRYRAGDRTTISGSVQRALSANAGDLYGGWGLEMGRVQGSVWGASAGLSRRISKGGTVGADYSYQTVTFGRDDTSRTHGVSLSYNQQLTPRTDMSVSFGPRFVDGWRSLEAAAGAHYRLERGQVSIAYGRSRYPAPSRDVDTENITLSGQYQLSPTVVVSASPGYFMHRYGDGHDGRSFRMQVSTSWQIRPEWAVSATYQHIRQDSGPFDPPTLRSLPWIARNLLAVSFSVGVGRPRQASASPGIGPINTGSTR